MADPLVFPVTHPFVLFHPMMMIMETLLGSFTELKPNTVIVRMMPNLSRVPAVATPKKCPQIPFAMELFFSSLSQS